MIGHDCLRRVRETARIDEVAAGYLTLRRSGKDLVALCPFHDERHPSFRISPALNIGKCFSCGEAADPIRLVRHMEGCGFEEAVRLLARKYGIEVEEERGTEEAGRHEARQAILRGNEAFARSLLPYDPFEGMTGGDESGEEGRGAERRPRRRGDTGGARRDPSRQFPAGHVPADGGALPGYGHPPRRIAGGALRLSRRASPDRAGGRGDGRAGGSGGGPPSRTPTGEGLAAFLPRQPRPDVLRRGWQRHLPPGMGRLRAVRRRDAPDGARPSRPAGSPLGGRPSGRDHGRASFRPHPLPPFLPPGGGNAGKAPRRAPARRGRTPALPLRRAFHTRPATTHGRTPPLRYLYRRAGHVPRGTEGLFRLERPDREGAGKPERTENRELRIKD